ncbi:MAG: ATP-binding protein [Candidatus Saccharimonadales bacterium]
MRPFLFIHKNGGGRRSSSSVASVNLPTNLKDETQRFKVIIETIEDGVVLIDSNQQILLMNPGAGILCGWAPEDATGISADALIKFVNDKGEPIDSENNPLLNVFNSGESIKQDNLFILNKENKQISVAVNVSPLLGDQGKVSAAVVVMRDITKEKEEEQQRADFISTASHEMRTPVAAIEGYLALALNEKVANIDSKARGYLEKAHSSTQHLGKLFQDLLTSAKAEDGRLTSNPVVVELGEFLDKLYADLKLVADKKGLEMDFRASNDKTINATMDSEGGERVIRPLYYVYVDPERLREVITNLFDNAVKYTPEGRISLGLTGNKQVAQCYIRDTGPGIPAEDLPHLFQKLYRVDNSATRTIGGTGLGLFICRKIIEMYNGQIWVESTVGKGSTFFFNLPRLENEKAMKLQSKSVAGSSV